MVFAVLERNHIAISGISENLEHFAGKHPIVSMQNSRTRFDDEACHEKGMSRNLGARSRLLGLGNGFVQAFGIYFEYRELGVFKHV